MRCPTILTKIFRSLPTIPWVKWQPGSMTTAPSVPQTTQNSFTMFCEQVCPCQTHWEYDFFQVVFIVTLSQCKLCGVPNTSNWLGLRSNGRSHDLQQTVRQQLSPVLSSTWTAEFSLGFLFSFISLSVFVSLFSGSILSFFFFFPHLLLLHLLLSSSFLPAFLPVLYPASSFYFLYGLTSSFSSSSLLIFIFFLPWAYPSQNTHHASLAVKT